MIRCAFGKGLLAASIFAASVLVSTVCPLSAKAQVHAVLTADNHYGLFHGKLDDQVVVRFLHQSTYDTAFGALAQLAG